jgi:hypothetical protein
VAERDRWLAISSRDAGLRTQKNAASRRRRRFSIKHVKRNCFVLGRPGSDLLSQGLSHSTIGAEEFNGRVRDGIGFKLLARTTRPAKDKDTKQAVWRMGAANRIPLFAAHYLIRWSYISLGHGPYGPWTLKMRAIKPIERLVPVSYTHYCASTPGLSTWSSSTVLKGILVLRWVSRLDAFSGYPVRT